MITIDCEYRIKDDVLFMIEAEKINMLELSQRTQVSRTTLNSIIKSGKSQLSVYEKIYSYFYRNNYRLNSVKEELEKERTPFILFHGSRNGLREITSSLSRASSDVGSGFYLGESYNQALSFVCEKEDSSIYSFTCSLNDLLKSSTSI